MNCGKWPWMILFKKINKWLDSPLIYFICSLFLKTCFKNIKICNCNGSWLQTFNNDIYIEGSSIKYIRSDFAKSRSTSCKPYIPCYQSLLNNQSHQLILGKIDSGYVHHEHCLHVYILEQIYHPFWLNGKIWLLNGLGKLALAINPFVPNAPFHYPLKTSENLGFLMFSGGRKMMHWERMG